MRSVQEPAEEGAVTPQWAASLQRKLGVAPTPRQTHQFGFEPMGEIYRQSSAEFFGTFVLVFASSMAVLSAGGAIHAQGGSVSGVRARQYPDEIARQRDPPGNHLGELGPSGVIYVAAAVGAAVIALSFLFARVSGGHFNCAITLSFMLSKRVSVKRGCFYMLAQFLGSVLAGAILKGVVPSPAESCLGTPKLDPSTGVWTALSLELTFTLLLALVYLVRMHPAASAMHGGIARRQRDFDAAASSRSRYIVKVDDDVGGYATFAVAAVYVIGTCAMLPFTGAAMNPMRHFGPAIFARISCNAFKHTWVFWAGPMSAGLLAALLHDVWFRPSILDGDAANAATSQAADYGAGQVETEEFP